MSERIRRITELYDAELQRLTGERSDWTAFLRFADAHYRYPFDQQLLIYAQRPNAVVVLPMEDWNLRYGRWVARGSRAIAVFDERFSSRRQLRFLFDVADTVETNQTRPLPRFALPPEERLEIVDALEASVGLLEDRDSFEAALRSVAQNAVRERLPDILREVLVSLDGSFLESCTDEEIEGFYADTLTDSVAYVLLTKCGCDPARALGENPFAALPVFDTPLTLTALGTAASDLSRDVLIDIVQIQRSLKAQQFARTQQTQYNETEERGAEYGDHLHDAERVSDTESGAAESNTAGAEPLGAAAPELPAGAPPHPVHAAADDREAGAASAGNTDRYDRAAQEPGAADDTGTAPDRADESGGSAELDAADEPDPQHGGRAGHAGNPELNEPEQSIRQRTDRDLTPSALSASLGYQMALDLDSSGATDADLLRNTIPQETIDDALLRACHTFAGGPEQVVPFMAEHSSWEERTRYIKEHFGIGGMSLGDRLYEGHNAKGLEIKLGSLLNPDDKVMLTWRSVTERLALLYRQEIVAAREPEKTETPELNMEPVSYRIPEAQQIPTPRGPKARYRDNLDAIRTLKAVETEGRYASP